MSAITDPLKFIHNYLEESISTKRRLLTQAELIWQVAGRLSKVAAEGGVIYTCGNGGSTCDAMHFAEELVARYKRTRPGIKAQHLCDPSTITCWANDFDFETAFARQAETFLTPRDAIVLISTSGNSKNIIEAAKVAKAKQALTIGLLGKSGGELKSLVDYPIVVPSEVTSNIQEAHIAVIHMLCEMIEDTLYPEN